MIRRRRMLGTTALAAAGALAPPPAAPRRAHAQAPRATPGWPERPIRFVITAQVGGVSDIFIRIFENRLRERLGQPLWIDPRPGAGGSVGGEAMARATDNHTIMINHIASHGIGPTLHKARLTFDPLRDTPGIARIAALPNVLIVKGDGPVRDLQGLVAYIKANPRRANFASAGAGTSSHLSGVLFGQKMGLELTHVPYRGTGPSMAAVLNGEVLFAIDNAPASRQHVLAGPLRALGVSTARRASTMPELPTLRELGVPDFDVSSWYGIAGPASLPRPVVARLEEEFLGCMNDPEIARRFRDYGAEPWPLGTADYNAFLRAEVARWAEVIRTAGVTAD
ncbi:Bug family tripartite tricarboxylate transporter substrate binding protein [Caldovatus aquaticus]|uniref:Tripartite tricarboxylate transporter substrate binding protein n=1 Tax=Caldovatus aquaticus TaxID=2865671 RepID=A0ABS7F6J8_9PROT|nr:tripartite tricarboxylate transporter substrate binding protein [Caldovatus aquaticus]MBW8271235.1 tripartite tricarboxylate transporter substrate binding protein [Caldovatus aquaticus]